MLKETAASLIAQEYEEWEWIIVDDGSTDDTVAVSRQFEAMDVRIKCIVRNREPRGACACRNIGLEMANGTYVIFLDSDDILSPQAIRTRVEMFTQNPECDFLVFNTAFFKKQIIDADAWWNIFSTESDLLRFLRGEAVWHTTGPIWKRTFLMDFNVRYDEDLMSGQDLDFHMCVLLNLPTYKTINSLPDVFIRRDQEISRISQRHFSKLTFENRIGKWIKWTTDNKVRQNADWSEKICVNIARECLNMIMKGKDFDRSVLNRITQSTIHVHTFKPVWKYLKYANELKEKYPFLLSLYNKLFYKVMVGNKLSYNNFYRTPLSEAVKSELKIMLKNSTKI